jgi:hypothetical protein
MPVSKGNKDRKLANRVTKLEEKINKLAPLVKKMDDALYKWGATSVYLAQGAIAQIALQDVLVSKGIVTDEELTEAILKKETEVEDGTTTEAQGEARGETSEEDN